MALLVEPIRYDQTYLQTDKRGLLASRNPLDLTALTAVDGLVIEGVQPSGTDRRVLLKWGTSWKRWTGSAFADAGTQSPTVDSVLSEGNTVAELDALTGAQLAPLVGQQVSVAVALSAPLGGPYPTIKVGIAGKSNQVLTVREEISPEIVLSSTEAVEILDVVVQKTESGGTVQVTVERDGSGVWEGIAAVKGQTARKVRIKGTLSVTQVGTSTATLSGVTVRHRSDAGSLLSTGRASIISKTFNFAQVDGSPLTMKGIHLMCYRPDIPDTEVKAYVSLRPTPGVVANEVLGVGDGKPKTFTLAHPEKVAIHTLRVWWGEELKAQGADYAFSSADGKITTSAPSGVEVRVAYQHGWEPEAWQEITRDAAYPSEKNPYTIIDQFGLGTLTGQGSVSSLRMDLVQKTGETTQALGTATGSTQVWPLEHSARPETIVVRATQGEATTTLPASAWSYDPITQVLRVSGPAGAALAVQYGWIGRQPSMDAFAAIWHR